ncbi:KptA family-domain-containing protein [Terfezia claveryi]|nr:KptA family-domain-containing protein [Terfezia claveryi]
MPRDNHRGGRGRRDEGPRGGQGGDVVISKALSFTLRHGAIKEGLPIQPDGYANVQDLLDMPKFRRLNLTLDTLRRLVQESDKQRYQLATIDSEGNPVPIPLKKNIENVGTSTTTTFLSNSTTITTSTLSLNPSFTNTPSSYLIRATQGHSIPLSSTNLQLTPITTTNLPPHCIHGTFYPFLDLILASGGLKAMGRNHIHFAPNLPQNSTVISGMRRDAQLLFYIDLPKASAAGIPFWRSENEVILSEGDAEKGGLLGMEYVQKIVDIGSAGLGTIWEQGNGMVKELPEKLRKIGVPRGKERVMKHMSGRGGGRGGRGQGGGSRVELQDGEG